MTTNATVLLNPKTDAFQPASAHSAEVPAENHDEWLLDEALAETFPASDPIAVSKNALATHRR